MVQLTLFAQKSDTVFVDEANERGRLIHGLKDGEFEYIDKEGIIYLIENYASGKLHGKVIYYYTTEKGSKQPKRTFNYINGLKDGDAFTYNKDGTISTFSSYCLGKINGSRVNYKYIPEKQLKYSIINYYMGELHGKSIYFDNMDTSIVYEYSRDKIVFVSYYDQGKLSEKGFVCEVLSEIKKIDVEEDAYIRERELSFVKDGIWNSFDTLGAIIEIKCFDCGKLIDCNIK